MDRIAMGEEAINDTSVRRGNEPIEPWLREVRELHAFFQHWLGGTIANGDDAFVRVEAALAPGFTFVTTSGAVLPRDALLAGLRAAHGSRPDLEIRIEEPVLRFDRDGTMVATYVEHQCEGATETRRMSTAVFERHANADRPIWLHVHETWIT